LSELSTTLAKSPLSYSQESLWYLAQLDPENTAYNQTYLLKLDGQLDITVLERAINEVIRRHSALRTIFAIEDGVPYQVIQPFTNIELPIVDFSNFPEEEKDQLAQQFAGEKGHIFFDLTHGPLMRLYLLRLNSTSHYLMLSIHHAIFDGWSRQVFMKEMSHFYNAYLTGDSLTLPEPKIQYADFAEWQHKWLQGDRLTNLMNYWKEQLSGELTVLELPIDHPRSSLQTFRGIRHFFKVDSELTNKLKAFCKSRRLTPFMVVTAAYFILLMQYTGQEDIIIGCPFANRSYPELSTDIENTIGMFINTMPLRMDISDNPTVKDLITRVQKVVIGALSNHQLPFERLVAEIQPERDLSRTPIFQAIINMRNFPRFSSQSLIVSDTVLGDRDAAFDLSFELNEQDNGFSCAFRYNVDLFEESTIARMAIHYQRLLEAILVNSDLSISELEMLTPEEKQQILYNWNTTEADYPQACIHDLISKQAWKNSSAPAVICGEEILSYGELDIHANQLAHFLQSKGVSQNTVVGIFLPRSGRMVISQLATIKAGGAYLPLDTTYPLERIRFMLEDAQPKLVITVSTLLNQLPDTIETICLDTEAGIINGFEKAEPHISISPDELAYVIYTSGSTGHPKGVMSTHRGAVNFIAHMIKAHVLNGSDRVLQLTPLSFDASVRDTLGTLIFGGTILLMDDEQMRNPDAILSTITKYSASCILSIVPTMLNFLSETALAQGFNKNNDLRLIMPSGEILQIKDVQRAWAAFGSKVKIVNQYGPTECSMISAVYTIEEDTIENLPVIPIGKPISNTRLYILDKSLKPVPIGAKGELYIGGLGVGRGYINQSNLTMEHFIHDPYSTLTGGRMYKTGDVARYWPDGTLEFYGRQDNQVKLRGYRVELGEIEAVLRDHPSVKEIAVVLWSDISSDQLIAYVVLKDRSSTYDDLREFVARRLPFYMVPSSFVILDSLPLTPNRKIDRRALPRPDQQVPVHVVPRNDTERRLLEIWKEILNLNNIGVTDNFFDIGGHSLMAVRLFARIENTFGTKLPLTALFQHGTVEELARLINKPQNALHSPIIIPMQTQGNKTPIFFVPGLGTSPLYMRELALGFSPLRPVYGLQSVFQGKTIEKRSIDETAKLYCDQLLTLLPDTPIALFGHSAGGLIALEVAHLLTSEGKLVTMVGLLDSYPPGPRQQASWQDRMRIHAGHMRENGLRGALVYLGTANERIILKVIRDLSDKNDRLKKIIAKLFPQKFKIANLKSFVLKPYSGNVTLFKVSERPWYVNWDPMENWSKYLVGNFNVVNIPGNHMSLLSKPNAEIVARAISDSLPE
jgi:amino acid adenylation domain-containing protein